MASLQIVRARNAPQKRHTLWSGCVVVEFDKETARQHDGASSNGNYDKLLDFSPSGHGQIVLCALGNVSRRAGS